MALETVNLSERRGDLSLRVRIEPGSLVAEARRDELETLALNSALRYADSILPEIVVSDGINQYPTFVRKMEAQGFDRGQARDVVGMLGYDVDITTHRITPSEILQV